MVIVIQAAKRMKRESNRRGTAHFHILSFSLISLFRMLMRVSMNSCNSCFVSAKTAAMDFSCAMVRPPQSQCCANDQPYSPSRQHHFDRMPHDQPVHTVPSAMHTRSDLVKHLRG